MSIQNNYSFLKSIYKKGGNVNDFWEGNYLKNGSKTHFYYRKIQKAPTVKPSLNISFCLLYLFFLPPPLLFFHVICNCVYILRSHSVLIIREPYSNWKNKLILKTCIMCFENYKSSYLVFLLGKWKSLRKHLITHSHTKNCLLQLSRKYLWKIWT